MHLLIAHDFRSLKVGDIVQGIFEGGVFGAVKVPDMPAIPIHKVAELPSEIEGRMGELRVKSVPGDATNESDYEFTFLHVVTPKIAHKVVHPGP